MLGFLLTLLGCGDRPRYERLTFEPGAKSTRVLMIGNSLTYTNDLPGLLQQFSAGQEAPIYIEKITTPYSSLKYHWNRGQALRRIREGHWDYVVLQEFSRGPVTDPAGSLKYFEMFDAEVRAAGAKSVIFENWTRRGRSNEFATLTDTYERVVKATGAASAPIGTAWRDTAAARPEIGLLADGRHPTEAGTYLAAAVLFDVVYGTTCSGLPTTLAGPPAAHVPLKMAMVLREIADQAVYADISGPAWRGHE